MDNNRFTVIDIKTGKFTTKGSPFPDSPIVIEAAPDVDLNEYFKMVNCPIEDVIISFDEIPIREEVVLQLGDMCRTTSKVINNNGRIM